MRKRFGPEGGWIMRKDPRSTPISETITARRSAASTRAGYLSLLMRVVGLAVVAWLLLTQVFLITQMHGQSMFPAMKDGDLIIGYRLQREYAKGDVIVYTVNGETHVGRIVARENDYVQMGDSGALYVNGMTQSGEIIYPTYAREGAEYPQQVPEGSVYVLGDYRTNTQDSRDFGAIPIKNVQGKVITILRRRGL